LNQQSDEQSLEAKDELVTKIPSSEFGVIQFKLVFDDRDQPTVDGETYHAKFKVGNESVYFNWEVEVKVD